MAGERNLAEASSGGLDWSRPIPAEPRRMKRATYEDVLNAPENKVAEILDGELFLSPRPAPRHAVASSRLGFLIGGPFDQGSGGPGGWWILDEPELHFGEQVVVPDLAGWRRERLPAMPEEAFFSLAPDWVCALESWTGIDATLLSWPPAPRPPPPGSARARRGLAAARTGGGGRPGSGKTTRGSRVPRRPWPGGTPKGR